MAEEEAKKVEPESCSEPPPPPSDPPAAEEKTIIPPPAEEKPDESKAIVVVEKCEEVDEKKPEAPHDRDAVLARVATEKRLSLIKAWEESEKSKAENKAQKKVSAIGAWENSKKANLEADSRRSRPTMSEQDTSTDVTVDVQFDDRGIHVGSGRTKLVQAITKEVTHCDHFSPCIKWATHKRDGRVDDLWRTVKDKWKLPNNENTKKWFNETANARWKDHKTRRLKPFFHEAPDLATAKARRPEALISAHMWEELCDQFHSITHAQGEEKSKSEKSKDSRKVVSTDHHWGRTSISSWSHKYLEKFGKNPTVVDTYKKAYLGIDALEEHGSTIGEDGTEQPYIGTATPEQLAISADLERVFEESIAEGNEESTANTLAIKKVLGKRKALGITSSNSSSRRGGTSRLSSSRQEEMEVEMKLLREQMQDKDDKMEKLQEQMREQAQSFNALLESLRQQGIQAPPPTTSNNGGM